MTAFPTMTFPEEITTERLSLRWPVEADAEEIFVRYAQDPEVTRYLTWRPHTSIKDTLDFHKKSTVDREEGRAFPWLIRSRETRLVLGMIGLRIEGHIAHLGYVLARDAWDQGVATEAARAVVAVGQQCESLWRIEAYCDVENETSARVLQKAGLSFEGTHRREIALPNLGDEPRDVHCYAVVRCDDGRWT